MTFRSLPALFGLLVAVTLPGCLDESPQPVTTEPSVTEIGQAFDPRSSGTIRGEIVWLGPLAAVPPFEYRPKPESPVADRKYYSNPNAPVVDAPTQGVGNAVVFLRSVDPARSKPWDHAGVFVELSRRQLRLEQGDGKVRAAFARRGEPLTMKSADDILYIVRAGGAAFFSLTFAEPREPRQRRLEQKGLVELSSAAGHYWQRAYVFVDDHPYYTRTDARGGFLLERVPEGNYQVVCWLPNWHVKEHERDPETSSLRFVTFGKPLEIEQSVSVLPRSESILRFQVGEQLLRP
jgi:hypothetical protein